jgi:hypothetical protein
MDSIIFCIHSHMNPSTTSTSASPASSASSDEAVLVFTDINTLIKWILNIEKSSSPPRSRKIVLVVDNSGSTGTQYMQGMTILEKEEDLVRQEVLSNPHNVYYFYTFESNVINHGIVKVLHDEQYVDLPNLSPMGGTDTHKALNEIVKNLKEYMPDEVRIYTDGSTNSGSGDFIRAMREFKSNGIELNVVAVTHTSQNLDEITCSEAARIPGMDLIYMLDVKDLSIHNKFHHTEPFKGATSSAINKSAITFMNTPVAIPIPVFINKLLDNIIAHKATLHMEDRDFTKIIVENGKLLLALFNNLNWDHCFINSIVQRLTTINSNYNPDRIRKLLNYGFDCAQKNKPIVYTNVDEHAKDASAKKTEFANATQSLNTQGTTLGAPTFISIPKNGACIIANRSSLELTRSIGGYPSSADAYDNCFVAIDGNDQAVRQAMRAIFHKMGYPDAQRGPTAIFLLTWTMASMSILGIPLDCTHMIELRKIAVIQASMEVMVSNGKYDGQGCLRQWKSGRLIPMHYSKSTTHLELYTDKSINPLNLPQLIWWALMMCMFGIFTEQLNTYQTAVTALCNEHGMEMNEKNFLMIIRKMYEGCIVGKFALVTLGERPQSFFTLESFPIGARVSRLKNHRECCVNALYNIPNEVDYVNQNGCLFCRYKPIPSDWEDGLIEDTRADLVNAMRQAVPLNIRTDILVPVSVVGGLEQMTITSSTELCLNLYELRGPTGCGKTTTRLMLRDQLVTKGYLVFVVSPDDINKVGGRNVKQQITDQLREFVETSRGKNRAIILDMCNERQSNQSNVFGNNLSDYKAVTIMPNFDKAQDDYRDFTHWCLSNVLGRPMHGPDTMFWLNPQSAGVATCIKVHNAKVDGIMMLLNIPNRGFGIKVTDNMDEVLATITAGAARHAHKLSTRPSIEDQMKTLLRSNGF